MCWFAIKICWLVSFAILVFFVIWPDDLLWKSEHGHTTFHGWIIPSSCRHSQFGCLELERENFTAISCTINPTSGVCHSCWNWRWWWIWYIIKWSRKWHWRVLRSWPSEFSWLEATCPVELEFGLQSLCIFTLCFSVAIWGCAFSFRINPFGVHAAFQFELSNWLTLDRSRDWFLGSIEPNGHRAANWAVKHLFIYLICAFTCWVRWFLNIRIRLWVFTYFL